MFSKHVVGVFALSSLVVTVTPSIDYINRIPMGGAVLYSRQSTDCPTLGDCTCEDWGMSCDLETYDWYDCSDTTLAG